MPASTLTAGYALPSQNYGQAGVTRLYIVPFSASTNFSIDSTTDVIQYIGAASSALTIFFAFDCVMETSSAKDGLKINPQNGSWYSEQVIDLQINKPTLTLRNQMNVITQTPCHIICLDRNGNNRLYGKNTGCWATDGAMNVGKLAGDAYNYTVQFTAKEPKESYYLTGGTGSSFNSTY